MKTVEKWGKYTIMMTMKFKIFNGNIFKVNLNRVKYSWYAVSIVDHRTSIWHIPGMCTINIFYIEKATEIPKYPERL